MKPLSLRSRLLLASVILVALGLVAAEAATYVMLRSNLVGRVDDQLEGSRIRAEGAFNYGGEPQPRGEGVPPPDFGEVGSGRHRESFPEPYAAKLDSSGNVVDTRSLFFGTTAATPILPGGLPGSAGAPDVRPILFTTGSEEGTVRFRVLAAASSDGGGTIVVAFPLTDVDATLNKLLLVEAIVTAVVLAAVAALALWLVRVGLRPLTQMEHAAADIADGDLSRRVEPADDRTEVGRLGSALNVMLERIEAAFAERRASEARLRRFVADASHELRTPLTSIRGYAELFRHGADARPEDLSKTMRRIEDESTRMTTLVEELLLLARLDQGRPLERRPVDLAKIAADAVQDARAVQPDRPIELPHAGGVFLEGDEARLRQVAANLLSNALQHTPHGTPVVVRVAREGNDARLTVTDQGPGLEAEHAAKVFDRFFRVDPARSRDNGGAGLGLAIVAAIVNAHDGTVSVETAAGRGTTFVVAIPVGGSPRNVAAGSQGPHRLVP